MSDRADLIKTTLAATPWGRWRPAPIAGDASRRAYTRLIGPAGQSVILMDAPPESGEDTRPFARLAETLTGFGLAAPAIHLHRPDVGILVIADLGHDDFAKWLRMTPDDTTALYDAATDILIHLHHQSTPEGLPRMDPATGAEMVAITCQFYTETRDPTALTTAMKDALARHAPLAETLALRDFHAENLIWRPDKAGLARVGLLDFQDAFVAPAGYDLVSLTRDARRDIPAGLAVDIQTRFAKSTGQDPATFAAQCACLGVQRNLRILGVFARLIRAERKLKYAQFIPRVWAHVLADLAHPALTDLRATVLSELPPPDQSTIAGVL